jgi:hypothetical protein
MGDIFLPVGVSHIGKTTLVRNSPEGGTLSIGKSGFDGQYESNRTSKVMYRTVVSPSGLKTEE